MTSSKRGASWLGWSVPIVVTAIVAWTGCGADTATESAAPRAAPPPGSGGSAGFGGFGGGVDAGSDSALPPEKEVESAYEFPVATGRYVWVANPLTGRVAFIDASTLAIQTTEAGNGPTYLTSVPDPSDDVVAVINTKSHEATVLRADSGGNLLSRNTPLASGVNSWAVSKSGAWAIAWSDYRKMEGTYAVTEGFQDLTVISLAGEAAKSTTLSVGYRPVAVRFSEDDARAYAVTQDGVSVIELGPSPIQSRVVATSQDPLEDPGYRDVAITPDGKFALVRRETVASIAVVDLNAGTLTDVALPGAATDMDLSADGKWAVVVVRETSDVVVIPVPGVLEDPAQKQVIHIADMTPGSVALAASAAVGLLYSNATGEERVARLDYSLTPPTSQALKLHAQVDAVFLSDNARAALVMHPRYAPNAESFSVISLDPILPAKIVSMKAKPVGVSVGADGMYAVMAEADTAKQIYGAYLIRPSTQQVDRFELASPPVSVGIMPLVSRAFVAQKHPEGRVTFVDLGTGLARTLTGFELGARVVDGTAP